jgi:hypothetical protein
MRGVKQPADWTVIRAEYIAGNISYRELALKHGVTYASLRKRGSVEGWAGERRRHSARVAAELQAKTFTTRVSQLHDWNEKDLRLATVLRAKLSRRLIKINDDSDDPADGLSELRAIAAAAESVQRMGRLALGATTDNQGVTTGQFLEPPKTLAEFYAVVEEIEVDDGEEEPASQTITKGNH